MLCDFIHDKAKRLFTKYENALKEKKHGNEDKLSYYHRKISQLELENQKFKESINLLKVHVIPKIANLLNKSLNDHAQDIERVSGTFVRELLEQLDFNYR